MLGKLSLSENIDLLGIRENRYIREEPNLGLPNLLLSDGPVGAHTAGGSTAYTAEIALAASWDPALAERMGSAIGEDARARGVAYLLGPGVNIYRAPMNGRNFEYFGEDPYLASQIVVGYIKGVKSNEVIATVKHFALNNQEWDRHNNQEWDRHNVSSDADERTMREISGGACVSLSAEHRDWHEDGRRALRHRNAGTRDDGALRGEYSALVTLGTLSYSNRAKGSRTRKAN
jgi:beta-glucosidase